jgi:hypothetical protein
VKKEKRKETYPYIILIKAQPIQLRDEDFPNDVHLEEVKPKGELHP